LPVAILGALILGVVAVFRSFVVVIPEGANGLLAKGGRYLRTLGSGSQFVLPHIAVSHLVTRRTIPFDVPVWQAPTADNVRARLDTLLTFSITDPYRFVFTISADDFDTVLSAICQDALRSLIRSLPADQLADLPRPATQGLLEAIALAMAPYGVSVHTVVVTQATPPPEFAAAQEARQLAAVELAAAEQQQRLALQRQQDRAALAHQQVLSEAASEAFRLAQLEERLAKYPGAARYDLARARLAVAQALAGNTRAMLQVGRLDDLAQALVLRDALPPAPDLAEPGPEVGEAAQRKVWPDDR
jgi:regulator of protease activity HflC (stomatin/prohibitin superfamily)